MRPSLVLDILAGASSVFGTGGGGSAAPVLSLKVLRESSFIAMPDEIEQAQDGGITNKSQIQALREELNI